MVQIPRGPGWLVAGILSALGLVSIGNYYGAKNSQGVVLGDAADDNVVRVTVEADEAADRQFIIGAMGGDKYAVMSDTDGGLPDGLGTMATQNANAVAITGGSVTGITDLAVADGGTGRSTATAYMPLAGGTTSTGAHQSISAGAVNFQPLQYQGASALPAFGYPIGSAAYFWYGAEHFVSSGANFNSPAGPLALTRVISGTGATISQSPNQGNCIGVVIVESGTDANSRSSLQGSTLTNLMAGLGRLVFRAKCDLSALSDATDTYVVNIGFYDSNTADSVDGMYFKYTHGTNGGEYQAITVSASSATTTDTNVAAVAGTFKTFEIDCNAAGTSVVYKIDGTTVGTIATNLPTSGSFTYGVQIYRTAGTSNERYLYSDYMELLTVPTSQ